MQVHHVVGVVCHRANRLKYWRTRSGEMTTIRFSWSFPCCLYRNPDAPAPEGALVPAEQDDSDDDMSSTSSFSDDD